MKNLTPVIVALGLLASSALAQYGIPDDDNEAPVRAPNPAFIVSKYGEAKPELILPAKTSPEFDFSVERQYPVVVAPAPVEATRVVIQAEKEYPKALSVRVVEKPLTYYSVPSVSTQTIQIRESIPPPPPPPSPVYATVPKINVVNSPVYASPPPPVHVIRESYLPPQTVYSSGIKKETVPIVSFVLESDHRGTFNLETVSGDGITKQKSGHLKDLGDKEGPVQVMSGSYSYTGDDGKLYRVDWKADEKGYTASGNHLPSNA